MCTLAPESQVGEAREVRGDRCARSPQVPKAKRKAESVGSRAQLAGLVVPKKVKVEANGGSEQVQMSAVGKSPSAALGGSSVPGTV